MTEEKISLESLDADIRKIGVLLERLESKFGMLYEVHLAHEARFREMDDRMERIERRMDGIEMRMDRLDKHLEEGIEFIAEKLDKKLDRDEFLIFKREILPQLT